MTLVRPATPADAEAMAATVSEGFASYVAFAPEGWRVPDTLELAIGMAMRLRRPGVRGWVAEDAGGAPLGHATTLPAADARRASHEPGLAHLEQLFVRRAAWGTGIAHELHDQAVAAVRADGCTTVRLFTPTGQARALAFYEREGYVPTGDPFVEPPLGLELIEMRLELGP